jgi:hypothetical protein
MGTVTPSTRDAIERGLASSDEDTRWQAAIHLGEFVQEAPDAVWAVLSSWGCSDNEDLRMALATCVLEHLLEHHFAAMFPRVEDLALRDRRFADTFLSTWRFGQSELPANVERFEALQRRLREGGGAAQQ